MSKFENRFFKLLEEDIDSGVGVDPKDDFDTLSNSVDDQSQLGDDLAPAPTQGIDMTAKYVERAKGWLSKINEFSEWLNSAESESLNKQLIAMDRPNTAFDGISAEAKKVTGIASDLAELSEKLKGIILKSEKLRRDIAMQKSQMGL